MSGNNDEKKEKIIKLVEKNTSDMDKWPEWKKHISLTDSSTYTVSTSSEDSYSNAKDSDE